MVYIQNTYLFQINLKLCHTTTRQSNNQIHTDIIKTAHFCILNSSNGLACAMTPVDSL